MRKKAHAIQKQNIAPHMLSHGGYEYLENKLMEEKKKKQLEEASQSRSTDTVIDPPSPIRRHVKWKMTRTKKTGQMTSEAAKEIANKIVSHFQLLIAIIYVYCVIEKTNKCVRYKSRWRSKPHREPVPLGD